VPWTLPRDAGRRDVQRDTLPRSVHLFTSTVASCAERKGVARARKNVQKVKLLRGTVPHEIIGVYGAGRVVLRPASAGTGVIAGSAVRAVLEAAGITDILSKSIGSNNPHNMAKATLNGLLSVEDLSDVEAKRNVGVKDYQLSEKE